MPELPWETAQEFGWKSAEFVAAHKGTVLYTNDSETARKKGKTSK
ncbi:hypothetical protein MPER_06579 [Moniliophthora perniciosa FA553]|nr:hypothetical protein MPER_06579 [Moniliophthora perniciosa FA553]